jgi:hypothetical protein
MRRSTKNGDRLRTKTAPKTAREGGREERGGFKATDLATILNSYII